MIFREAKVEDIPQIQFVRHAVKENVLSNPALVTDTDCQEYMTVRGKGWVCEIENVIVAFAIADLKGKNIWALFVHPLHEKKGIGKHLHRIMLDWYFSQTKENVWLSTDPKTRAEVYYSKQGWSAMGITNGGESKFEMSFEDWLSRSNSSI